LDSRTWVFCDSLDGDYPVPFCGTEEEMVKAASDLLSRYRKNGFPKSLTVWTGYSWRKKGKPYCEIDEAGVHVLNKEVTA